MKFILIGDCAVGKSCFMNRLIEDRVFSDMHTPTIGVDFGILKSYTECGHSVKCQIWDTSGQERFEAITRSYYKNTSGVILMFDVTSEKSFENIERWHKLAQTECEAGTAIILVGNKIDKPRAVTYEQAYDYALKNNMSYIEMSLVTGKGYLDVVPSMIEQVMLRIIRPGLKHVGVRSNGKRLFIESVEKRDCCVIS